MDALLKDANEAFRQGHYHQARNSYLRAAQRYGAKLFRSNLQLCTLRERDRFLCNDYRLPQSDKEDPLITYCVPSYNRLGDVQKTLLPNLRILARFRKVRLLLLLFDNGQEAYTWVRRHCRHYLDLNLLQVYCAPPLSQWHAPTVRNSFQPYVRSGYYAALDGDNYLTEENVMRTKQAILEFGPCIIHQFQGQWGDGTCGGIVLPAEVYRRCGYTKELLPRQFDELSLIANVLSAYPDLPLVTRTGVNILSKSHYLKLLTRFNGWNVTRVECDLGCCAEAEDTKKEGYSRRDPLLQAYSSLNAYYSLLKASRHPTAKAEFRRRLAQAQKAAIDSEVFDRIAELTLEPYNLDTGLSGHGPAPQIAVIQDYDKESLWDWLKRQRQRGYRRFLLVNANGDDTLTRRLINEAGVTLFKPRLGDCDSFKDFWVKCLSRRFKTRYCSESKHLDKHLEKVG